MGRRWRLLAATGIAVVSVGCVAVGGASPTPLLEPASSSMDPGGSGATVSPTGRASLPAGPTASMATDRPPDLLLAAEGGDPVAGRLGSYTWDGGGSDSPWLPGSPVTVGAGEPLTVRVENAVPLASWTARIATAGATSDAGAAPLAEGSGPVAFVAPDAGTWTIELAVRFVGGGSATYAWRLTVH